MNVKITLAAIFLISPVLSQNIKYPSTNIQEHQDTIFEKVVDDPFQWMEKTSLKRDIWLEEQSVLLKKTKKSFFKYLGSIRYRLDRLSYVENKNYKKQGSKYYYLAYKDDFTSPVLVQKNKYTDEYGDIVIDPRSFAKRKEQITISGYKVNKAESHIVFSLSHSGSDWREVRIKNLNKDRYLDDVIKWVKYSPIYWKNNGFFYWKWKKPEKGKELLEQATHQKLYYHKINTKQEEDKLIFDSGEAFSRSSYKVTSDERYLLIYTFDETEDGYKKVILFKDLNANNDFKELLSYENEEGDYSIIEHLNNRFFIYTNNESNNGRVFSINPTTKEIANIIPEYNYKLDQVDIVNNKIICLLYKKGKYTLLIHDLNGKLLSKTSFDSGHEVALLEASNNDKELIYTVNSFYFPSIVYKLDLQNNSVDYISKTTIAYDHEKFETKFMHYKSKDGTYIPAYLTYKKGTNLTSGNAPVFLHGYGGFGSSMVPHFDPGYILFMKSGGVVVTPQIRGGGELGNKWHKDGIGLKKQNSFDDFIYAAKHLIKIKLTNPSKIAIHGGSNGGLLVGVCMVQEPHLFKVVVSEMGVFDMLRLENYGVGYLHHKEFGSITDSLEFQNLLGYSPYHNIEYTTNYPATLVITADHDDRVPPFHSYKFVAKLQQTSGKEPILLNVEKQAGHHGVSTLKSRYNHQAVMWSFIFTQLGMKPKG